MKIVLAADHGGFELKEKVKEHLQKKQHTVIDIGAASSNSVDYPDYGRRAAEMVADKSVELGVLFCGTGIGMSITANKVKGIRAALCHEIFTAKMARAHNDANILVLGARVIGDALALAAVDAFLETPFEGGRHQARLDKIKGWE